MRHSDCGTSKSRSIRIIVKCVGVGVVPETLCPIREAGVIGNEPVCIERSQIRIPSICRGKTRAERGIVDGGWVWVHGAADTKPRARMKALVTERVGKGVAWSPFHFGGWYQGEDQRSKYPRGADPVVLGESVNTLTTYGFDPVTGMQEPKATLCQIRAA